MATNFKINYSGHATPIESMQATDTSNVAEIVHSSIDKSIAGSKLLTTGTTAAHIKYKDYTTTDGLVDIEHSTVFNDSGIVCDFLMVKIREAASTGTPDCWLVLGGDELPVALLSGIGDFLIIPIKAINGQNIFLKSTSNTTLAKVDILMGEVS